MSANTELINRETLDSVIADIKTLIKRTSLDALNSVQWEFNQRYLFGNEPEKPLIKSGKLFTKEGPVAKGAIWTSLDTGRLWMNTGSGWKNIGGLNNINKPDLIEIFHPRTDYPVEEPVTRSNVSADNFIQMKFKKYEKYSVTKTQCPFTGYFVGSNDRTDIVQDVRNVFSSGPGTYEFICMVDDAKYFYFTTGSSSNVLESFTLTDMGSAIEPIKLTNVTASDTYVTFPIEKGKRYYYTKTAISFFIGYGKGTKDQNHVLKGCNNSGDSGAGSWSFVADEDADWIRIYTGNNGTLESFELRSEDLPDYKLTYPYVVKSGESFPSEPKVGDMVFDGSVLKKVPKWWNGTSWITANGDSNPLCGRISGFTSYGSNSSVNYEVTTFGVGDGPLGEFVGSSINYVESISTLPIMENLMSSASAHNYLASIKVVKDYVTAKLYDFINPQIVTFSDYSGETIIAEDKPKIIITYSFGSASILDFTNITKTNGKEIEITNLNGNTFAIIDGNTKSVMQHCIECVVKCICINNTWRFFKTASVTEVVEDSNE